VAKKALGAYIRAQQGRFQQLLRQPVACFMIALKMLTRWHFWHCRTV